MARLEPAPKFKLTAWVVAKRHNVKMFPMPNDAEPKNGNCKPGTMVDSAITSPYFKDYYLQSHSGIKGTAKSAHYFPLVDEMGLSETQFQEFVSASWSVLFTWQSANLDVDPQALLHICARYHGSIVCHSRILRRSSM